MPLKYPSTITTNTTSHTLRTTVYTHTSCTGPDVRYPTAPHRLVGTPRDVTAPTNPDPRLHNEGDVKLCESAARCPGEGGSLLDQRLQVNEVWS